MSNFGLERALTECGIPFVRTEVGDRYVLHKLQDKQWQWGGETSGHIVCLDKAATGDAIIASLLVLQALIETDCTLAEAVAPMEKYPQAHANVSIGNIHNGGLLKLASPVEDIIHRAREALAEQGRVLIRPSGTEPMLRIMVESHSEDESRLWAERIATTAREHLPQNS